MTETKGTGFGIVIILTSIVVFFAILTNGMMIKQVYNAGGNVTMTNLPLEEDGNIPVSIQDQTTQVFSLLLNEMIDGSIYLTQDAIVNTDYIILNAGHSVTVGDSIALLEENGMARIFYAKVLAVNINNITLDTLINYGFISGDESTFSFNDNMNSDGSTIRKTYSIINYFSEAVDITRFIFHCTDNTAMDDSKFCGQNALTRGFILRKKQLDGTYVNLFNIKKNGDWVKIAYDTSYDDKAPAGLYGFGSRITYAGQEKHGAVIRLLPLESIEAVNQDDCSLIEELTITAEGHFTQN